MITFLNYTLEASITICEENRDMALEIGGNLKIQNARATSR